MRKRWRRIQFPMGRLNEALQKAADAKSQAEKELNSAKDALAQAEKELNAVKRGTAKCEGCGCGRQRKDTADQTGEAEKKDTNSTITQKLQQLEETVQEKQNTYDTIQAKVTEKQAALDSASVALEEKQEQLESIQVLQRMQRKPQSAR